MDYALDFVDAPLRATCEEQQLAYARSELVQLRHLLSLPKEPTRVKQDLPDCDLVCFSAWRDGKNRPMRYVKVRDQGDEAVFQHPTPVFWHHCYFRAEIRNVDGVWHALGPLFKGWRHAQALIELYMEGPKQWEGAGGTAGQADGDSGAGAPTSARSGHSCKGCSLDVTGPAISIASLKRHGRIVGSPRSSPKLSLGYHSEGWATPKAGQRAAESRASMDTGCLCCKDQVHQ